MYMKHSWKMNHILDHKISLNQLQKISIFQSMFSDSNEIKLEFNKNEEIKTILKYLEINTLLNNSLRNISLGEF